MFGVEVDIGQAQAGNGGVALVARLVGHPLQGHFGNICLARVGGHFGQGQTGLLGVAGACVAVFHVVESALGLGDVATSQGFAHFVIHGCSLRRLAALPVVVAVPPRQSEHHHDQHAADEVAVFAPEMLEFVELFLFFEVELVCHGGICLRGGL